MTPKNLLRSLYVLALCALPSAAHGVLPARGSLATELARSLVWDQPAEGALWAATSRYKACFSASGACFVPVLGAAAPCNTPAAFALRSVRVAGVELALAPRVEPVRVDGRVVYDRGPVREVYEPRVDGLAQSFEFEPARFAGEVVLELAVASELERGEDEQGLVLRGEYGAVRYSRAFVLDASREPAPIATHWSDAGIQLVVPAAIATRARGALVVDPLITTYGVSTNSGASESQPDVAFDRVAGEQGVVFELPSSGADRDVLLVRLDAAGTLLGVVPIDLTTDDWARPRVAYNHAARAYLGVAEVTSSSPPTGVFVGGRAFANATGTLAAPFDVSPRGGHARSRPDVGGDANAANVSGFCVAWESALNGADHDVELATIDTQGVVGPVVNLSGPAATLDEAPSISKWAEDQPGSGETWCVAWTRSAAGSGDVLAAQVNAAGAVVLAPFDVDAGPENAFAPSVSSLTSSAPGRWLVAYARTMAPGNADLFGKLLEAGVELDSANLTLLVGSPPSENQTAPSADCDGRSFVVAWTETSGGQPDTYLATFADVGGQIAIAGASEVLGASNDTEDQPSVCAARAASGASTRSILAAWRAFQGGGYDVAGAAYSANPITTHCSPGVDATQPCPCGNAPSGPGRGCRNSTYASGAMLLALGDPDTDTVTLWSLFMKPNVACIVLQGDSVDAVGVPFGDGVRCIDGQLLRMAVRVANPSGTLTFPSAGDPSLATRNAQLGHALSPGEKRGYQVYYRDAQNFACPTTFNVTNAVQVQW
ncbi:MAG: hypothetical protein HZA53_07285 [Planctomycetes bacterium]|nr:hypothetical protein [Planctomycetota bacterium]